MVVVPNFGMYCSIQYIVPKAWADALLIFRNGQCESLDSVFRCMAYHFKFIQRSGIRLF